MGARGDEREAIRLAEHGCRKRTDSRAVRDALAHCGKITEDAVWSREKSPDLAGRYGRFFLTSFAAGVCTPHRMIE